MISLRLLLDTNVIIDFLKQTDTTLDLPSIILEHECFISVIVKLKLPDAIIGATAIVYESEIVTRYPHFLKFQYEKLKIWDTTR